MSNKLQRLLNDEGDSFVDLLNEKNIDSGYYKVVEQIKNYWQNQIVETLMEETYRRLHIDENTQDSKLILDCYFSSPTPINETNNELIELVLKYVNKSIVKRDCLIERIDGYIKDDDTKQLQTLKEDVINLSTTLDELVYRSRDKKLNNFVDKLNRILFKSYFFEDSNKILEQLNNISILLRVVRLQG